MNPLNWPKHIPKSYWNSDTHKAVVSGSNDAAAIIAAPFALLSLVIISEELRVSEEMF